MLSTSNQNTQRPTQRAQFLDADQLRRAYLDAVSRAGDLSHRPPGYRIFWYSRAGAGEVEVHAVNNGVAHRIVGRHTSCDIVLPADPHVSLRHLLIRVVSLADGLQLRVLDLESHIGFRLDDDVKRRAMLVRGPLVMRVGMNAVIALPSGAEAVRSHEPPNVRIENALPAHQAARLLEGGHPYRAAAPVSRVTLAPRVQYMGSEPIPDSLDPAMLPGPMSASPVLELTLRRGYNAYTVRLTGADLDRGMLIGRSSRCHPALLHVLGGFVSRVHGLIVRERDEIVLYDLGAMNGTFVPGTLGGFDRVRRVALSGAVTHACIGSPAYESIELLWRRL